MEIFTATILAGIAVGSVYGLIGLSLCSIFNASRLVNFAQGEFAMLGAFAAYVFLFSGPRSLPLGILGVIVLPLVAAVALHYLVAEPLIRPGIPVMTPVLALLGGSLIITGIVGALTDFKYFDTKMLFGIEPLRVGFVQFGRQNLAIVAAAVVLAVLYWLLLNKTTIGLAVRMTGIDAEMAAALGVNLGRIRLLTWCIGAAISAIAGFWVAPLVMPSALVGTSLLVKGFIAAVFGGFGDPYATLGGGLILGLITSLFSTYVSAGQAELLMFLAMLAILAIRPAGLMARSTQT